MTSSTAGSWRDGYNRAVLAWLKAGPSADPSSLTCKFEESWGSDTMGEWPAGVEFSWTDAQGRKWAGVSGEQLAQLVASFGVAP